MNTSGYTSRQDAELERMAAGGDREAFAELYNRHFDRVYDFSLRLLRDTDEAADAAQETFLKAMAALSPKEKHAAFTTWILTIARNISLNRLRASKGRATSPSLEQTESEVIYQQVDTDRLASPEEALEAKELAGLVWQAAAALDPKEYSLLDLHLRQGLDGGEIATMLGKSKNSAYIMLSRLKDSVEESITAFIMAKRGRQTCLNLSQLLEGRRAAAFDADTRKLVTRHIESCSTCREQRKKLVSPTAILGAFAAVPVPLGLKQQAMARVLGQWTTLAGSEAANAGGFLSHLFHPVRAVAGGAKHGGWFAGWKAAALVAGTVVVAGGVTGGALVYSGALSGGSQGAFQSTTGASIPSASPIPTPTIVPTPFPTTTPTLTVTGGPGQVGIRYGGVQLTDQACDEAPAVSQDGTMIAFIRGPAGSSANECASQSGPVMVMSTDGSGLREIAPRGRNPTWSPDGSSLAVEIWYPGSMCGTLTMAIINVRTGEQQTVTSGNVGGIAENGWSPDSKYLLLEACDSNLHPVNTFQVYTTDGTLISTLPADSHPYGWTADGKVVLQSRDASGKASCVLALPTGEVLGAPSSDTVMLTQRQFPWEMRASVRCP